MDRTVNREIALFAEMAELTKDQCASCRVPFLCCTEGQCEVTIAYAKETWGVDLEPTGHPRLQLLGEKGCIAAPHLRPLCTIHTCQIASSECGPTSEWTDRYFALRREIEIAMEEREFG